MIPSFMRHMFGIRLGCDPSTANAEDQAEGSPTTGLTPTSHCPKGSGGGLAGRAMGVRRACYATSVLRDEQVEFRTLVFYELAMFQCPVSKTLCNGQQAHSQIGDGVFHSRGNLGVEFTPD